MKNCFIILLPAEGKYVFMERLSINELLIDQNKKTFPYIKMNRVVSKLLHAQYSICRE